MREDLMVQQQVSNVWQHMVGVICLNQTNRKTSQSSATQTFKKYPDAVTFPRGRKATQEKMLKFWVC